MKALAMEASTGLKLWMVALSFATSIWETDDSLSQKRPMLRFQLIVKP